jgi:hypothetical protein
MFSLPVSGFIQIAMHCHCAHFFQVRTLDGVHRSYLLVSCHAVYGIVMRLGVICCSIASYHALSCVNILLPINVHNVHYRVSADMFP